MADFECRIHGTGVPNSNCGSYPELKVKFDIAFTRDPNDKAWVHAQVMNMDWEHPTSANYTFRISAYIGINDSGPTGESGNDSRILQKVYSPWGSQWWSGSYVTLYNPVVHFISTDSVAKVTVYVRNRDNCTSNGYCFNFGGMGTEFCPIEEKYFAIEPYEEKFTVSYNANGGDSSTTPASQEKSSLQPLQLTTAVPTYPVQVNYLNTSYSPTITGRRFDHWNTAANNTGTSYPSGGWYTANAPATLYAQWWYAPFHTPNVPQATFNVRFEFNGGTGYPASVDLVRSTSGFDKNPSAVSGVFPANYDCLTDETPLNLYPIYGAAVLPFASIPTPVRTGYAFKGWYADQQLTIPITSNRQITSNTTIYAKWMPLPIHKRLPNGTWSSEGPYVHRWNSSQSRWEDVPVYQWNGSSWVNKSV